MGRPSSNQRSRSGGGGGDTGFPTEWTNWEWNAVWKCESRYRQVAANGNESDYEYDYRGHAVPRGQTSTPASPLSTIQETPNTAYAPDNYTYNIQDTTTALASTHLDSPSGGEPLARTLSGQGRPTSAGKASDYYSASSYQKTQSASRHIFPRDASSQTDLDPEFKVHESWEFKFGRVFKVLWSEPTGSTGTIITGMVTKTKHGQYAYSSIRRFVIVDSRHGHCICLPILTYGGQGTLKKGVHASDHAVIYTGKAPMMKAKEKITKRAIRMVPISPQHKLDNTSRINYAKLYTIEHNVKVYFIGSIAPKYEQQVVTDYNATHKPLPDRPYYAGTSDENTFGYAQGADPGYAPPATTASWPTSTTNQPISSSYYSQPSMYGPAVTSHPASYAGMSQPTYASNSPQYNVPNYSSGRVDSGYSPQSTYAVPTPAADPQRQYNTDDYEVRRSNDLPTDNQEDADRPQEQHDNTDLYDA